MIKAGRCWFCWNCLFATFWLLFWFGGYLQWKRCKTCFKGIVVILLFWDGKGSIETCGLKRSFGWHQFPPFTQVGWRRTIEVNPGDYRKGKIRFSTKRGCMGVVHGDTKIIGSAAPSRVVVLHLPVLQEYCPPLTIHTPNNNNRSSTVSSPLLVLLRSR